MTTRGREGVSIATSNGSSNNVVECVRCGKRLIREEFESHICTTELKAVRHIAVDYWWLTKNEKGEELTMVKGLDGYFYRLTVSREKGFGEMPPGSNTRSQHHEDSTV